MAVLISKILLCEYYYGCLFLSTTAQTTAETLDESEKDGKEENDENDEGNGMKTIGETVHANAVDVEGLGCVHDYLGRIALRATPQISNALGAVTTGQSRTASTLALVTQYLRLNGVQRVHNGSTGVVLLGVLQWTGNGVEGIVEDAALGEASQDQEYADQGEHDSLHTRDGHLWCLMRRRID